MEVNIPGGILLFFPSYEAMTFMMTTWETALIKFQRDMFFENKGTKEFESVFKRYLKRI